MSFLSARASWSRCRLAAMLTLGLLAAPLSVDAQPKVPRIGVLHFHAAESVYLEAFRRGLRELGYVEGQNLAVEYRYTPDSMAPADRAASELVALKVDLIVAGGTGLAQAAQRATRTIPIVFALADEPVAFGLVASVARPGGNVTGLTTMNVQLTRKRLQLLKEAMPALARVAVLGSSYPIAVLGMREASVAASILGLQVQALEMRGPEDLERLFAQMTKERAGALLVLPGVPMAAHGPRIAALALKHRLPGIGVGGLMMGYGANTADLFHRAATFVDRILKGAKPADLPVEQPARVELVINRKIAKVLGLTMPPSLLLRADQVLD